MPREQRQQEKEMLGMREIFLLVLNILITKLGKKGTKGLRRFLCLMCKYLFKSIFNIIKGKRGELLGIYISEEFLDEILEEVIRLTIDNKSGGGPGCLRNRRESRGRQQRKVS